MLILPFLEFYINNQDVPGVVAFDNNDIGL